MPSASDVLLSLVPNPPLGFRFGVFFMLEGMLPNLLDTRFKSVSGIGATLNLQSVQNGGQNLFVHQLPERVQYENLVLERGLAVGSILAQNFDDAMCNFSFHPSNVLVSLLDESGLPLNNWLFTSAIPVRWRLSNLDADSNQVAIETLELSYQRMQAVRL